MTQLYMMSVVLTEVNPTHPLLCEMFGENWTKHAGQSSKAVADAHQDGGIAGRNVQMINVESCVPSTCMRVMDLLLQGHVTGRERERKRVRIEGQKPAHWERGEIGTHANQTAGTLIRK